MKKKGLIFSFLGILVLSSIGLFLWRKSYQQPTRFTYFASVPSVRFSDAQIPTIDIEIEDKIFAAKLDLGFVGQVSATAKLVEEITEKTFIGHHFSCGWNGKKHENKIYEIPEVKIGGLTFCELRLKESSAQFENDAVIIKDEFFQPQEVMRVGWRQFHKTNLFLDLGNSCIMICDSIATWKAHGNSLDNFIKIPLLVNPITEALEIATFVDHKPYRCVLDTGFTFNVLRKEDTKNLSFEEALSNPDNISEPSLQIGDKDFGPTIFHEAPIIPDEISAILGMEFFLEHQVYFDFPNEQIYISLKD